MLPLLIQEARDNVALVLFQGFFRLWERLSFGDDGIYNETQVFLLVDLSVIYTFFLVSHLSSISHLAFFHGAFFHSFRFLSAGHLYTFLVRTTPSLRLAV